MPTSMQAAPAAANAQGTLKRILLQGRYETMGMISNGGQLVVAVVLPLMALFGLVGNRAELASADALDAARLRSAADEARLARRWEPWSGTPWRLLGESQLQAGDVRGARSSFLRGLEHDRGDWELWLDLALVSRGEERRAALAHVAELNPQSAELRQLTAAP